MSWRRSWLKALTDLRPPPLPKKTLISEPSPDKPIRTTPNSISTNENCWKPLPTEAVRSHREIKRSSVSFHRIFLFPKQVRWKLLPPPIAAKRIPL